jgi:ubiquitin-activating enzyme E1
MNLFNFSLTSHTFQVSNLNRQFLFRRPDVGHKKSEVAARAFKAFNRAVNIEAMAEIVSEGTEHVFSDDFFQQLNGVCNALDNVEAREFPQT